MKKSVTRATAVKRSPTRAASTKSSGRATAATGPGRRPARELCVTILHALDAWDDAYRAPTLVYVKTVDQQVTRARVAIRELFDRIIKLPPSVVS